MKLIESFPPAAVLLVDLAHCAPPANWKEWACLCYYELKAKVIMEASKGNDDCFLSDNIQVEG